MVFVRIGLAAISTASLVALSTPAHAQNFHVSRLYEQVLENINYARPGHFLDSFGVVRLDGGKSLRIELDVPPRTSIQIMGDCDEDCSDLDLGVYSPTGKLLAEDRLDDFYPIVTFVSEPDGRIEIELDMVECETSYCYTSYSVFIEGAQ